MKWHRPATWSIFTPAGLLYVAGMPEAARDRILKRNPTFEARKDEA
jgi:hypothetical protein